jgi:putative transposase
MLLKIVRNKTSTIVVIYSLYLYFLVGLSLLITSKALDIFDDEKRSHIAIRNRIQKFGSCNLYKRKRISAFLIAEIVINY